MAALKLSSRSFYMRNTVISLIPKIAAIVSYVAVSLAIIANVYLLCVCVCV